VTGAIVAMLAMLCAALGSSALVPRTVVERAPERLERLIPKDMPGWREAPSSAALVSLITTDEGDVTSMQRSYDDSLLRSFWSADGRQMMLAIAYDQVQREERRVHRPELCYVSQGFQILYDEPATFHLRRGGSRNIEGRRMLTRQGARIEAVSFWIRTGDRFSQNPWHSRLYVVSEGLAGRLHDGILVRVSEIIANPSEADASFARQAQFLDDFVGQLDGPAARFIASSPDAAS
jgi:EpsI family protein